MTTGADCPLGSDCDENVLNKMAHSSNRDKESKGVTQEFAFVCPIKLRSDHATLWKRAILHKSGKE